MAIRDITGARLAFRPGPLDDPPLTGWPATSFGEAALALDIGGYAQFAGPALEFRPGPLTVVRTKPPVPVAGTDLAYAPGPLQVTHGKRIEGAWLDFRPGNLGERNDRERPIEGARAPLWPGGVVARPLVERSIWSDLADVSWESGLLARVVDFQPYYTLGGDLDRPYNDQAPGSIFIRVGGQDEVEFYPSPLAEVDNLRVVGAISLIPSFGLLRPVTHRIFADWHTIDDTGPGEFYLVWSTLTPWDIPTPDLERGILYSIRGLKPLSIGADATSFDASGGDNRWGTWLQYQGPVPNDSTHPFRQMAWERDATGVPQQGTASAAIPILGTDPVAAFRRFGVYAADARSDRAGMVYCGFNRAGSTSGGMVTITDEQQANWFFWFRNSHTGEATFQLDLPSENQDPENPYVWPDTYFFKRYLDQARAAGQTIDVALCDRRLVDRDTIGHLNKTQQSFPQTYRWPLGTAVFPDS